MDAVLAALNGTALWPEIRASSVCVSCALSSLAEQSVNPTFPVNTTCDWTVRQQTAKHWPRAEGPPSRLFFKVARLRSFIFAQSEFQSFRAELRDNAATNHDCGSPGPMFTTPALGEPISLFGVPVLFPLSLVCASLGVGFRRVLVPSLCSTFGFFTSLHLDFSTITIHLDFSTIITVSSKSLCHRSPAISVSLFGVPVLFPLSLVCASLGVGFRRVLVPSLCSTFGFFTSLHLDFSTITIHLDFSTIITVSPRPIEVPVSPLSCYLCVCDEVVVLTEWRIQEDDEGKQMMTDRRRIRRYRQVLCGACP
ncbi:hypothetical protein DPX16_14395 [Anabarilius grahami]|uniref:Uncharacterized protein n=1 Tax=Anabarilius grahami TaxID=495550 RepID=A0A3N0XM30_ANAGA|nr:hypothetical protein DPX16_14395 [Anabarilius grahami]